MAGLNPLVETRTFINLESHVIDMATEAFIRRKF